MAEEVVPGPTMLEDFSSLRAASDEAICRYANGWGLLGLCAHGLPVSHLDYAPVGGEQGQRVPVGTDCDDWAEGENLEWWRYWSGKADASIRVAGALQLGRATGADAWRAIWSPPPSTYRASVGSTTPSIWNCLGKALKAGGG